MSLHPGMHHAMQRAQHAAGQRASPHNAAAGGACCAWRLPHTLRPSHVAHPGWPGALHALQGAARAPVVRASEAGGNGEDAAMTAEEEAAYEAFRQQQKEARLQKRSEYKRRRNFDPLASRYAEKGAAGAASAATAAPAADDAPATAAAAAIAAGGIAAPSPAASGRTTDAANGGIASPVVLQRPSLAAARPAPPSTGGAHTAASSSSSSMPAAAARPRMSPRALSQRQQSAPSAAASTPTASAATLANTTEKSSDSAIDFEAVVREMADVPEARVVPARAPKRRTPAQLKAAAAGRALAKEAQQEAMQQLAALQRRADAAAAQSTSSTADDNDDADGEDELDWDALGQYEAFESYVGKEKREQAAAAARDAVRRSSSGSATSSNSSSSSSSSRAVASAPAARARMQPVAKAAPTRPPAAAAAAAAAAPPVVQKGAVRRKGRAASPPAADGKSKLDKELDELEQLVGFFESLERQGSAAPPKVGRRQQRTPAAAAAADAAAADVEEWAAVEKLLLGEGWEEDLWAALAEEGEEGEEGSGAEAALAVGGDFGGGGEEEAEPWADEVSTLLLGLVTISHKKYLSKPLHDQPVDEDARARHFWEAPYALLVHDDSPECRIEYANDAACKLFGRSYLDLFGTPSHELVAQTASAQEDWAFALREAEDGFSRHATVSELELAGAGGGRVVAKDVLVWRVDSLEDDAIGQAVLIKQWQAL